MRMRSWSTLQWRNRNNCISRISLFPIFLILLWGSVTSFGLSIGVSAQISSSSRYHHYQPPIVRPRYPTIPYTPGVRPWHINRRHNRSTTGRRSSASSNHNLTSKLHFVNILAFISQTLAPSITKAGVKVSHLALTTQPHRLLTPVFLHGGLAHLAVNTYSLHNVGPAVENSFGSGRFLATYLLSGVAGNVLSAYGSPRPSLGASGAVCGLMGAYYVFVRRNRAFFSSSSAEQSLQRTLLLNVGLGFAGGAASNIDNWGHLGGALGGVAVSYLIGPRLYLMNKDADNNKIVVDKPLIRLPSLDDLKLNRVRRRMRMDHYAADLSKRPWRK